MWKSGSESIPVFLQSFHLVALFSHLNFQHLLSRTYCPELGTSWLNVICRFLFWYDRTVSILLLAGAALISWSCLVHGLVTDRINLWQSRASARQQQNRPKRQLDSRLKTSLRLHKIETGLVLGVQQKQNCLSMSSDQMNIKLAHTNFLLKPVLIAFNNRNVAKAGLNKTV